MNLKKISKNVKKCLLFSKKVCIIKFVGPNEDQKKHNSKISITNFKKIKKIEKKY